MGPIQLQAYLMIAIAIFCAVRTYRDFAGGDVFWGIISLTITIAALVVVLVPIPTHAVKIELPR